MSVGLVHRVACASIEPSAAVARLEPKYRLRRSRFILKRACVPPRTWRDGAAGERMPYDFRETAFVH
jgi:hypothetical protein